jgi:hypothetical protein
MGNLFNEEPKLKKQKIEKEKKVEFEEINNYNNY